MSRDQLQVRELAAWGFDESPYRTACAEEVAHARGKLSRRLPFVTQDCVVTPESDILPALFAKQAQRKDLIAEMDGLDWTLGVVDLRHLIAFQRRVVFNPDFAHEIADDWTSLFDLAFGPPVPLVYTRQDTGNGDVVIETPNPNLRVWPVSTGAGGLFSLHGGSPFFEVGCYRGRWFLRDGYHRAYALLRAGIVAVPAVVVHARTLAELGPVGVWFYPETTLFSDHPPLVTDLLDDEMTIGYTRPRLLKTIRITVEESFAPATT